MTEIFSCVTVDDVISDSCLLETRTNIARRNPSVDRIWDSKCGNRSQVEALICYTECFGLLADSLGETVWLVADCRVDFVIILFCA